MGWEIEEEPQPGQWSVRDVSAHSRKGVTKESQKGPSLVYWKAKTRVGKKCFQFYCKPCNKRSSAHGFSFLSGLS